MIDPDFNPFDTLKQLAKNQETMSKNIVEIAKAFNDRSDAIKEMANAINKQDIAIRDLHARLQLLEIVRQYETQTTQN